MVLLRFIPVVADITLVFFFFPCLVIMHHCMDIPLFIHSLVAGEHLALSHFVAVLRSAEISHLSCGFVLFFFLWFNHFFALCVLKFCYCVNTHFRLCSLWVNSFIIMKCPCLFLGEYFLFWRLSVSYYWK